jgi:uncharacterized SAM-binding protein YcdF (DUF218 family)
MNATQTLYKKVLALPMLTSYTHTRAWVILPGGGNHKVDDMRLTEVCWDCQRVLVAGTRGDPEYSLQEIRELLSRKGSAPSNLSFQGYARHTPDQIRWVTQELMKNVALTHVVFSTAQYHLPRTVLTFIKMWQEHGDCRIIRL